MAERNLIGEGFITNTSAPDGSVSGTQVVAIDEMEALVDGNVTGTAVTVTGVGFTSLDADLGARWKLNRLALYTDEASTTNFDMSVSEDNIDFFPITMTGSVGLWVGSVSGTTVSGAPRYIRYEHRATSNILVQEWQAINDETLVDFGSTGTLTDIEIADAPIGRPSDEITELPLFNRFEKTAQGFVFIDSTGDKADDNIEIALSPSGPWFGRQTQSASQPGSTPWIVLEDLFNSIVSRPAAVDSNYFNGVDSIYEGLGDQDIADNLRVVSGTGYKTDFTGGTLKGWTGTGFTTTTLDSAQVFGSLSTVTAPRFNLEQTFGTSAAVSPDSVSAISNQFLPFRAEDYDTVELSIINPAVPFADFSEGPRLFWKNHTTNPFATDHSTLSTTPNVNGNGSQQTVTFDVGSITTWSGVISGLRLQPFTTVTGLGFNSRLDSLEVFKDGINKADRLALASDLVVSGTFTNIAGGTVESADEHRVVINNENIIKEPCIITSVSVRAVHSASTTFDDEGWFLCKFADDFTYTESDSEVNSFGNPFVVKEVAVLQEHSPVTNRSTNSRMAVYWKADPGDMVGYGYKVTGNGGTRFSFDTNLSATISGSLGSTTFVDITSTSTLETDLNGISNWATTGRKYNIQFKSVSGGRYQSTGTYTSPIFDGGVDPALLSVEFTSVEDNGTSIDVNANATLNTLDARASSNPPGTNTALARRKQQFMLGAHPTDRPSRFDSRYTSNYVIGTMNAEVEARETETNSAGDSQIENVGISSLWHEVNEELWVLNVLISGTQSADLRPIWDVYDLNVTPANYLRTQHVTGDIAYTWVNDAEDDNSFEPVGFTADFAREEIYIISREDGFNVGNGTYNGIILDLNGQYKDVFWRNDQLTQDIVDGGFEVNLTSADRHLQHMRTVTYRAPYFYTLTAPDGTLREEGTHIEVFRLGNNPLDASNPNDVEFITSIDLGSVAGLPAITTADPAETMTYVKSNDLFYFTTDTPSDDIYTFKASIAGIPPTESITITAGPIKDTILRQLSANAPLTDLTFAFNTANGLNPWTGAGDDQDLRRFMDITYCVDRDSLVQLLAYRSRSSPDFVREGQTSLNDFFWHFHTHTVLLEIAAETNPVSVTTPKFPNQKDAVWGTLSGTLAYEQVVANSILFPTGRYAQLRYQFNSGSGQEFTPYLLESTVSQGIRVSDIPASGTKNIFLRTNIAETETIGDQTGSLKVYWELQEC